MDANAAIKQISDALEGLKQIATEDKTLAGHILDAEQALRKARQHLLLVHAYPGVQK